MQQRRCAARRSVGHQVIWDSLDLEIAPGEFLAVLGPNGAGKTTLLKVLLGLLPLSAGTVKIDGRPPHRGSPVTGYVPQQRAFDRDLPIRGRDLVHFGVDGHRRGLPRHPRPPGRRRHRGGRRAGITRTRRSGCCRAASSSGCGSPRRWSDDPAVLLCDEPLLSLDLSHQQAVSELMNACRREHGTAVVFVTHEINPVLPFVDRVLYLVGGQWAVGHARRGDDQRDAERAVRHGDRRDPGARPHRRRRRR